MPARSPRATLAKLLVLLLSFSMFAAACGGSDDSSGDDTDTGGDDGGGDDGGGDDGDAGGDDGGSTAQSSDEEDLVSDDDPIPGGTLRVATNAEADGLNPAVNRFSPAGYAMARAVFEPLFTYNADGEVIPYLAESGEPSADGMAYTVHLRPDITFHDGSPLDAEAVVANVAAQLTDTTVQLAVLPNLNPETPVEVVGPLSVQFNMSRPNKQWNVWLSFQLGYMASPAWLAAAAENPALNQEPVGTGPFVFDSRVEDSVTRFVRNDAWWQGAAHLDAVEFYPVTDGSIAAGQLLARDLDGILTTNNDAQLLVRDEGDAYVRIEDDLGEESFAMFNSAAPPFDDIRVRQAATHAFPQANYLEFVAAGVTRPAHSMFAPGNDFHNPDVEQLTDMPELAGPLIEAYCADVPDSCTDGKVNVEFQYSGPSESQDNVASVIEAAWEPFFNVERQVLFEDDHVNEVIFGLYQFTTWRHFGDLDPAAERVFMACDSIGGISLNFPRSCNPDRDALLDAQLASEDRDERIGIWNELSQIIRDDYAYIFIQHTLWLHALGANVRNQCGATSPEGDSLLCTDGGKQWWHTVWFAE